ncbi:PGDYG domain-containing protein [Gelria sp. Kuro-4]|uniref:PGDYG domain-containing protein n=1 Tax=Gelria sp. Kuro-4 TaxID=2796927 RepID=UPI001BF14773|nr:PGDYG domain-containing protein [Gelria sp. Kuro-4]BCV23321.1 hypothetical protein kuro4_00940 [Gelria sp. Kuro-4]
MAKYRKKPVVIDAEVYRPGLEDGFACVDKGCPFMGAVSPNVKWGMCTDCERNQPYVMTLEGPLFISPGDYIITGVKGERYPCKPDVFEATYESVEEE